MSNGGIQSNLRLRKDFPVGVIFKLRFEGQNIWTGLLKIKKRVFFPLKEQTWERLMHSGS